MAVEAPLSFSLPWGSLRIPRQKNTPQERQCPLLLLGPRGLLRPTFPLPAKGRLINHRDPGHPHAYWEYPAEVPSIPTLMFLLRLPTEHLTRLVSVSRCVLAGAVCGSLHDTLSTSCDYLPHWHRLPVLSGNLFVNRHAPDEGVFSAR